MKIINVLLMGLLTCLAGGEGVKAQQPVCPSETCPCPGCPPCGPGNPCADCTCVGCCPSSVLPFTPHKNIIYTLSSGAYFVCDPSNKNLKPVLIDEENNYYTCSGGNEELPHKEFKETVSIKVNPTVVYNFPEGTTFKCDKTPVVVNKGLPSQYYICPVMSDEKTKLKANK